MKDRAPMEGLKRTAWRIIEAALGAADPRAAVVRALRAGADRRIVCAGDERVVSGKLYLLSIGKAAAAMAAGAVQALGDLAGMISRLVMVVPRGYPSDAGAGLPAASVPVEVYRAGHPVPDDDGVAAAQRVLDLVESMEEEDLCVLLLSGGGSSLLTLPAPGVDLAGEQATTSLLLGCGADIMEINAVRKHLSAIKGGRLAARCRGTIETLAISDVVGDPLSAIASGPTVPDPTTFADAWSVLEHHGIADRVPPAVADALKEGSAGRREETPKALEPRHRAAVIASNRLAVDAAARAAAEEGLPPLVLTTFLGGEAREAGRLLAAIGREVRSNGRPVPAPACLIAGGETTVTLHGRGRGGRNQELALAAALALEGVERVLVASFATDGREGNTEAAGAFGSGGTLAAGRRMGLDPRALLDANDSNAFLAAAGELIVTGPTGTNVNDVSLVLIEGR